MTIRQGQTVDLYVLTDLDSIDSARVSIRDKKGVRTIDDVTIQGGTVMFSMTQEDTSELAKGRIEVQLKAKKGDNVAVSNIMTDNVLEGIDKGVI